MRRTFRTCRDTTPHRWIITENDPTNKPLRILSFLVLVICVTIIGHTAMTNPQALGRTDSVYTIWTIPGAVASAAAFASSFTKRKARPSDFERVPELQQKLERAVAAYAVRRREIGPVSKAGQSDLSRHLEQTIGSVMAVARSVKTNYEDIALLGTAMKDELRAYEMDSIDEALHTLEDDAAFQRMKNASK